MKRRSIAPRPEWRQRVEAQGLLFHEAKDTGQYWSDDAYYELAASEIDAIESATQELHACFLELVQHVIDERRYGELAIPPLAIPMIEASWRARAPSLYGRMDLAFGPDGIPYLLEYNADTPTSLLEGAVIQWQWQSDVFPDADQYNALHDQLIATWTELRPELGDRVWFSCVEDIEDEMTIGYLRDTAQQAGYATTQLDMTEVGWDRERGELVDHRGDAIASMFKLYPWEGLIADPLAAVLPVAPTKWLEPAWKMILGNKAILPLLWQRFPNHPNILPAALDPSQLPADGRGVVKKPLLGREGSNVSIAAPGVAFETAGPYGAEGFVYQRYADLGEHDGQRPVIGSWVIGGKACGLGIREVPGYVTTNTARFAPHIVR